MPNALFAIYPRFHAAANITRHTLVFPGGALMAYRHPETTLVMVPMAESEHEFIDRDTKSADRAGRMTKRGGAS